MNKLKIFILLNLILFFSSCGTLKEGFLNQKKKSSDEFLVEKKSPLVLPPNYEELPVPQTEDNKDTSKENEIKNLISNKNDQNSNTDSSSNIDSNIEESLLEKIKKN